MRYESAKRLSTECLELNKMNEMIQRLVNEMTTDCQVWAGDMISNGPVGAYTSAMCSTIRMRANPFGLCLTVPCSISKCFIPQLF